MLRTCLLAAALVALLPISAQGAIMVTDILNLNDAKDFDAVSIFVPGSGGPEALLGDTYSSSPVVQDGMAAFGISDAAPSTHTFDLSAEDGGVNLAGPVDSRFLVTEAVVTVGNVQTVIVEWTSVDASGATTPWVDAGVAGPDGPFTSWRLDVGVAAGGTDPIDDPGSAYIDGTGEFSIFNSALAPLGTFPISGAPGAGSESLFGVGVVGVGGGDIAGLDVASIQMTWNIAVPEPSAFSLLAIGCLACLGRRSVSRRNR